MHAKVEIVFGKLAELAVRALYRDVLEELVLWDRHNTTIYLQFTSVSKKFLARIIVFFSHPQALYCDYTLEIATAIDAKLKIACNLVKLSRPDKEETYFAWRSNDRKEREDRIARGIEKVIR